MRVLSAPQGTASRAAGASRGRACRRARARPAPPAAGSNGRVPPPLSDKPAGDGEQWQDLMFSTGAPSYMQSSARHNPDVCLEFDRIISQAERDHSIYVLGSQEENDPGHSLPEAIWNTIRREAERDAAAEPLLSSFLYASILAHDTFERALAFVLANRLANSVMLPTQLFETFHEVLTTDEEVRQGALADVEACRERDPACLSYSQALLYYKGFHALQTHRIAHALWQRGQRVMATALQSRMSEVLAVDIHPAARLGKGILLDHGTGVVIGETAVVGNHVSLLQNVTLGGTGKEVGDRHPKVSDNVLIGANATVLGNIRIGEGAQIAAGSLVLKPVDPHTMVAGSPAKPVGRVSGNPAHDMLQWSKKFQDMCDGKEINFDPKKEPMPQLGSSTSTSGSAPAGAPAASAPAKVSAPAAPSSSSSGEQAAPSLAASAMSAGYTNGRKSGASRDTASVSNGTSSAASGTSSGTSSAPAAGSASAAPAAAAGPPAAQPAEPAAAAPPAAAKKASSVNPIVKAMREGDVDATMDDATAAVKWPKQGDPEYVI